MTAPLEDHLGAWLGAWASGRRGLTVVASAARRRRTWDGAVRPLVGATRPDGSGTIVVAPDLHDRVEALVGGRRLPSVDDDERSRRAIGEAVHGPDAVLGIGVLRWIARDHDEVASGIDPIGEWVDHRDPRVPPWLTPFGGEALVALDDDGSYAAGVGVKRHDDTGHELAVVTDEQHRGRGLARRLVATAARAELRSVPVVTYLHDRRNTASAHVADAVGFRDRGWRVLGVFGGEAPG